MFGGFETRKVAVLGYYGHKNFGDELILSGLRNHFNGWELKVYSIVSNGVYPTINFDEVNKCDLFVLGGGELIHKDVLGLPTPCRFKFRNHSVAYKLYNRTFFAHLPWVKRIKIPKAILGCGCDASTLNGNVIKDLAEFDYIGLRDQTSVNTLQRIQQFQTKTHLFYDLAFQNKIDTPTKNGEYAVVIPTGGPALVEQSGDWLRRELSGFNKVWFVPFGQVDCDDYYTARLLSTCRKGEVASEFLQPNEVGLASVAGLLASAEVVLPYRLHGLVLAFMLGKPFRFYPYHSKVSRVAETLEERSLNGIRETQAFEFKRMLEAINF